MKLNFILFSLFFTLLFSAFTTFIALFLCYIFDIKNYQNISITFFILGFVIGIHASIFHYRKAFNGNE
jgi:hypothetical protein